MVIKDFDYLSARISLFFQGRRRHSSSLGGLFTILMVMSCVFYIFYLIMSVCGHKISNFQYYKQNKKSLEPFVFKDFTDSSIFHYFQLYNSMNGFGNYNSKYLRIFMSRFHRTYLTKPGALSENEHWVYDSCRKGIDDEIIPQNLFINNVSLDGGACLRYYYDINQKKYYSIDDKNNFKYPNLYNNTEKNNNIFLGTIIEKCNNNSVLSKALRPCGKKEEIDQYIQNFIAIYLKMFEVEVDTNSYNEPIFGNVRSIASVLNEEEITVNGINLAPFDIEIKTGVFFPKYQKLKTYIFVHNQNSYEFNDYNKTAVLSIYNYWLQNNGHVFKGGYETLYDILPSIGGIIQFIYYAFFFINFLYNRYCIIYDCGELLFKDFRHENSLKELKKNNDFKQFLDYLREDKEIKRESFYFCSKEKNNSYDKNKVSSKIKKMTKKKDLTKKTGKEFFYNDKIHKSNNNNRKSLFFSGNSKIHEKKFENRNVSNSNSYFHDMEKKDSSCSGYVESSSDKIHLDKLNQNLALTDYKIIIDKNFKIDKKKSVLLLNNIPNKFETISKDVIFKSRTKQNDSIIQSKFLNNKNFRNQTTKSITHPFSNTITNNLFSKSLAEYLDKKNLKLKKETLVFKVLEKFITFKIYFCSLIGKGNKKQIIYTLDYFRKKLLSEEHLFRAHIILYILEKFFGIEENQKNDIVELYKNL